MLTNKLMKGILSPTVQHLCVLCLLLLYVLFGVHAVAVAEITHTTTAAGITVHFERPHLHITESPFYTEADAAKPGGATVPPAVHYADCAWLHAPGLPPLPATRMLLAIPADADITTETVLAVNTGTAHTYHNVPLQRSADTRTHYPTVCARIEMDGYIRSQRVISLALYPVQYHPATQQLRAYSSLTVFIPFKTQERPPPALSLPNTHNTSIHTDPYTPVYMRHILNYADYRKTFNSTAQGHNMLQAPAAPAHTAPSQRTRYKLYIAETGVYQLTAATLQQTWGVDLIGQDPRTLQMTHADQEIPIYVSGAADGSFDPEDAILFLAHSSTDPESPYLKNSYTRWNIYWLSITPDGHTPARVPQIEASPSDATAIQVPTFRSRVVFEEDHLTNNLEFVDPAAVSAGDKHTWFDALDFWFWDGIKNASDIGELRLEFPLYDVAKSFDPPSIHVVLQGGTPVTHNILAAVNGVQIDLATWDQQAQITLSKNLRVWHNLKDATHTEKNILSLTRIDTNAAEDTTRYPYHIYLNRFWVEYTRDFFAVKDTLRFRTPANPEKKGGLHQFRIDAFRNPHISVFETDGTALTAKLQGVHITHTPTDAAMHARLTALHDGDRRKVPDRTYTATFQIPTTRTTTFIAVSETALKTPHNIETVHASDLKNPLNGVDYLVLTHNRFRKAADRLATYRNTTKGGGYRTKVVDIADVYNTFGDGTVHPQWIKNFLTYAYQYWTPPALAYLVILGDGTYDFRGIDTDIHPDPPELTGYIPTHYIPTDSFGRTAADHWYGTVSGHDEFVDFYLGRLAVETETEADTVVNKIINYETQRPNGTWRHRIVSVADDEVSNSGDDIFKRSLNEIAKNHTRLGYETTEIYLEDVIDAVEANPEQYPNTLPRHVAKQKIIDALSEGAVIAQYAGHGGRIVWAHEAIFDNAAIDKIQETQQLPFMLVLSCYNGYFDAPGEPSMAEKLLRKQNGGIIGMLSATRLTYGTGNDALNRIIFDMLFQRDVRQLGPLSFDAKLEYLLTAGTSQLDIMLEYTLFGDPALHIAMADYEILPKIETKTVKAGDTLQIAPGYIQNVRYDTTSHTKVFTQNTNFHGELTVNATFPGKQAVGIDKNGTPTPFYTGDVTVTQKLPVKNGRFNAVHITVPHNIAPGDAHVVYAAQNNTHIAVGGDGFTVDIPKILDIQTKLVEDKIDIVAHISDDAKTTVAVVLTYRHPITAARERVEMTVIDTTNTETYPTIPTARWWKIPEPIPAPTNGNAFRYDIQITDADGFVITSDYFRFYPYTYPNLAIVTNRNTEQIQYENDEHVRFLTVDIEATGTATSPQRIDTPKQALLDTLGLTDATIDVVFFSGNPDIDANYVIDADAQILGRTQIKTTDWITYNPLTQRSHAYTPDPLNTNPIATVTIPTPLRNGIHDVFVYVDPVFSESDKPGRIQEHSEHDNIGYTQIYVSETVINDTAPIHLTSLDGGLRVVAPAGNLTDTQKPTVLAVHPILPNTLQLRRVYAIGGTGNPTQHIQHTPIFPKTHNGTPATERDTLLTPVALPTHPALQGYALQYNTDTATHGKTVKLQAPMTLEIDYDYDQLQQAVIHELFGNGTETPITEQTLDENVKTAVHTRAENIGAFLWVETLANWVRLDSQLKKQTNGDIYTATRATYIRSENIGDGTLTDVDIAPTGTQTGKYIARFQDAQTYTLYHLPDTPASAENTAEQPHLTIVQSDLSVLPWAQTTPVGFTLDIDTGTTPFRYGDMLRFTISRITAPGTDTDTFYSTAFLNSNIGTGTIQYLTLAPETAMPHDTWLVLFVSSSTFQIIGKENGTLMHNDTPIHGTVGTPLHAEKYGMHLLITHGTKPFAPGDRFVFTTRKVGTIQATTHYLGTLTCFHSTDTTPPDIQLTIGNQKHFVSGTPVSTTPLIQATLTDTRGIDTVTRPIHLEFGQFGKYETLPKTAYTLTHHPGSSQLLLTYNSPELTPREYQLRLSASDLDGNIGEREINFQVHKHLQLIEPLNYPNPFTKETTLTCELTRPAKSLTVKIYTLTGRLVRKLETDAPAGFIQIPWDGTDADGKTVANGVYFAKFIVKSLDTDADAPTYILKMMKLK